jgi:hypothetical protein
MAMGFCKSRRGWVRGRRLKAPMPSGSPKWRRSTQRRALAADLLQVQQAEFRDSIRDCVGGDRGCLVSVVGRGVDTLVWA